MTKKCCRYESNELLDQIKNVLIVAKLNLRQTCCITFQDPSWHCYYLDLFVILYEKSSSSDKANPDTRCELSMEDLWFQVVPQVYLIPSEFSTQTHFHSKL